MVAISEDGGNILKKIRLLISLLAILLVTSGCLSESEMGEDIMIFEELSKNKPTVEWKQRMDEGDDLFTDENINATNEVLNSYINNLKKLGDNTREEDILEGVKEVVINLNKLNEEYDYFIETMEREELCDFIIEAARIAGFESEEDITEEWREW